MKITNYILIVTTVVTSSAVAQAAFLAGWDFESVAPNQDLSSGLNADTVNGVAGAQVFSSDFVGTGSQGVGSASLASAGNTNSQYTNFTAADVGDNTVGTYSVKAQGGGTLTLKFDASNATDINIGFMAGTNIANSFGIDDGFGGINGPTLEIRTIANGGAATLVTPANYNPLSGTSFFVANFTTGAFSGIDNGLRLSALDGVEVAEIQISFVNNNNASANAILDNIWIGGTGSISVVPEPSTYALLAGVAGLALAIARRRK